MSCDADLRARLETKLLPVMGDVLRKRRNGRRHGCGSSWHVDCISRRVLDPWATVVRRLMNGGASVEDTLGRVGAALGDIKRRIRSLFTQERVGLLPVGFRTPC